MDTSNSSTFYIVDENETRHERGEDFLRPRRAKAMINARDAVVWVRGDTHEVSVCPRGYRDSSLRGRWVDAIGANYRQWQEMTNEKRVLLMLETAIDLAMQGTALVDVLREFAKVKEFRALGEKSYPMCRALTRAHVGQCLEPYTMTFEELLVAY